MMTAAPLCTLLTRRDAVTDANWLKRCPLANGAITSVVDLFEREEADICLSRERKERRKAGKIGSADSVSVGSALLWPRWRQRRLGLRP